MFWILSIIFACSTSPSETSLTANSSNPDDDSSQDGNNGSAVDEQGLPVLKVDYPQRASFDRSGSGMVEGRIDTDGSAVEQLTINGESVPVNDDGSFMMPVGWKPGIQILGTRVESVNGERATDGRAFHAGPTHDPGGWIESAIRIEIDHEILDDDDADLDDIAGLIELGLEDPELVDILIGSPLDMGDAIITPTRLDYGRTRVDLAPTNGALDAVVSLDGIEFDFLLDGSGLFSWFSTYGEASASVVDVGLTLTVASAGGVVRCEATEMTVLVENLAYDIHYIPDFLEGMTSGMAEDFIETTVTDIVTQELVPQIEQVLTGFAVGASFETDLDFDLRLAEVSVVDEGLRFEVDARVLAVDGMALPPEAGSMRTGGDAPDWPTEKTTSFWAAVDDDLMNQLAFAFWETGALRDIEFDAILLGAATGGPLPAPLGPAETVSMSLKLPPVLTPTQDVDWAAQVAAGEWEITFLREDGEALRFSVSARSHFQVAIGEEGAIEFEVDARPAHMEQVVGVLEAPEALDPGDLSALIKLLIPPLVSKAPNFIPDLPIPEIALDEFLSVPETEGRVVRVIDSSVNMQENGWLLINAGIDVY